MSLATTYGIIEEEKSTIVDNPLPPIVARKLTDLICHKQEDPAELLRYRYLCRGGILLVCGPTGIGKSSLGMQCTILWAVGREAFGIKPAKALKSVLIQAENDDGDLAEMRDGIIAGLNLTPTQAKAATDSVIVVRENTRTGARFFAEVVRPLLAEHKPDLLWIDPALSYLGGDTSSQRDVGGFLRNMLNPLLHEFDCGCVVVHHTNKPPNGREKPDWQAGDFAYLGSGSAEWANAARAVLALRSVGSHDVFELRAGKRGSRLSWHEPDGVTKSYARYLAHSNEPGVIYWREVDPDQATTTGRPKTANLDEVLELLPNEGLHAGEWKDLAKSECGIRDTSFHNARRALYKAGRVLKSKVSGKWQPIRTP